MRLKPLLVLAILCVASARALDFSGSNLINIPIYFKGNGTIAFPDNMDLSNGFNISARFNLETVKHEYIIWSNNRYLLQITENGYIQAGLYDNETWSPLVTYPHLIMPNVTYEALFSYNNSDVILLVNGVTTRGKFGSVVTQTGGITYIGNRDNWSRDLQGTIDYLSVVPYPKLNISVPSIPVIVNKTNVTYHQGVYRNKEDTITLWKALVDSYPELGSYESIGKSIKGNDIWLFKFGNPNGGRVMIDSQGHGSEDCGNEIGYTFVKWLLESNSPEAKRILKENFVMFIPVLNIDAYRRQNMRSNYTLLNGTVIKVAYGVDLNRNGLLGFGSSGSGNPSNSYEYRGLYAGSEPETQALAYAEQKYRPDIYVNTHCGMNMLRYCTNNNITKTIISQIKNVSPATLKKYGYGSLCTGGYIMTQARMYGANAWIFEIAKWEERPLTLADFNAKFYPLASPVFIAMCNSVGITG